MKYPKGGQLSMIEKLGKILCLIGTTIDDVIKGWMCLKRYAVPIDVMGIDPPEGHSGIYTGFNPKLNDSRYLIKLDPEVKNKMGNKIYNIGCICFFLFVALGFYNICKYAPTKDNEIKYENIVRILMNNENSYTFFIKHDTTEEIQIVRINLVKNGHSVKIFADVPEGEKNWALRIYDTGIDRSRKNDRLRIHIHSPVEINGGADNRGKYGVHKVHEIE